MGIVTFTSDWSSQDYYSGMLKGRLLSLQPDWKIVEITQQIKPFKTLEGAFILRHMMGQYPPGTIHLFLINQGNRPDTYPMVLSYQEIFLIAWEDAVSDLVLDGDPDWWIRITPEVFSSIRDLTGIRNGQISPSFPELLLFPVLAYAISLGTPFQELTKNTSGLPGTTPWLPVIQDGTISGRVIYIDSYGNAISNITRALFLQTGQGREFDIFLISNHYRINRITKGYLETEPGEMLALFNSIELLEVAIVHGNISGLLGIEPGATIKIKFYE